ncbi:methyl-accepting chemotaxis protein [Stigmatella aurantiaca]|uniref:Methyl-accepting chemotaxis protein n=1 Tax=Stigmatella aurantiaca TaxID=41 RepID=A0A1H8A8H4_STIAU|nr:methyl-accepting chemotaxis protein [Stigmatella aurantiaca]SEM66128.1 methyl-accepting chemotaxis protein [Stigmatella aurantiaca]
MRASIGRRLYVSFGLLVVAFAILGGEHVVSSNRMASEVESSMESTFSTVSALLQLRSLQQQVVALVYSVEEGRGPGTLEQLATLEERVSAQLSVLQSQGYAEDKFHEVSLRFQGMLREARRLLEAEASPRQAPGAAAVRRFHEHTGRLVPLLERSVVQEGQTARDALHSLRSDFLYSASLFGGKILGCIALALMLAFWVRHSLVHPLRELTRVAQDISVNGDLSLPVPVRSTDEVGQLAGAFRDMVERLRTIHSELRSSGDKLAESVAYMRNSSEQQQETVSSQAAALFQTRTTAEELRRTSALAAQKAATVLEVAERADTLGRQGEASLALTIEGLATLGEQVQEIAQRIRKLGESTQQIGAITQTVKNLADQSNMLALNAAIEAVRSGEHGKGFGVVAREIRSLADQSIEATVRVREILEAVGHAVTETVNITQKGAERMQNGLAQVSATGESLSELSAIMRDNANAVREIAGAVSQQDEGIAQIFGAVSELSRMMDDTEQQLGATRTAAMTLDDVSRRLTEVVTRYRT